MWTRLGRWVLGRTWDDLLQAVGLGGIVYVTAASSNPRPALVAAFGCMMGLPYFTGRDRTRRRRRFSARIEMRDDTDESGDESDVPPPAAERSSGGPPPPSPP